MEKNKYKTLVAKHTPKENRLKNGIIAFIVGGFVGAIGQGLLDLYSYILHIPAKQASVFMITTLIFIGCFFTALGFFDKLVSFARCGLIVPITGFAHSMMSTTLEYKKEGIVTGMGANMFKLAGTVIMCGVVSSYIFGVIRVIIMGG